MTGHNAPESGRTPSRRRGPTITAETLRSLQGAPVIVPVRPTEHAWPGAEAVTVPARTQTAARAGSEKPRP